jgi:hypothetical protein
LRFAGLFVFDWPVTPTVLVADCELTS